MSIITITKRKLLIIFSIGAIVLVLLVAIVSYNGRRLVSIRKENEQLRIEINQLQHKQKNLSQQLEAKNLRLNEFKKMIQELQTNKPFAKAGPSG